MENVNTGGLKGLVGRLFPAWGEAVEAAKLRDEGIEQVQESQSHDWLNAARTACESFIASLHPGSEFIGEHVRLHCLEQGVGEPNHPNAWGAVIGWAVRRALKAGCVEIVGVARASTASSHRRNNALYQVLA